MNIIQLELKLVHATWDENEQQIGRRQVLSLCLSTLTLLSEE